MGKRPRAKGKSNTTQGRGGSRKHPADCKWRNGAVIGRPKVFRPVDGNVARKIKARIKAEELWVFCVSTAAKKAKETGNTADLRQCLEYLDDRDLGRCTDNVNHMHPKGLEVTMNHTISERMKLAM